MNHNDLGSTLEAMEQSGQSEARALADFVRDSLLTENASVNLICASMDEFIEWAQEVKRAACATPRNQA